MHKLFTRDAAESAKKWGVHYDEVAKSVAMEWGG